MGLLEELNLPDDLNNLSLDKLEELTKEVREEIILSVAQTGGHLASSLGATEIAIALHSILETPQDKIIWDVGHQAYAHKILTGRKEKMNTLRQLDGLSGFPRREESEHDALNVGHSSTSISAALGMACARDLKGTEEEIVAVIGDGSLTAGMAFEALNHAGALKKDFTVILNDNEMSIAENVGAVSNYLNELRANPKLHKAHDDIEELLNNMLNLIPFFESKILNTAKKVKNSLKYLLVSGILFEEFGFTYLGPINGHDLESIRNHIKHAQEIDGPVLLHTITTKGKGYKPAENDPANFHGVSPFDIATGKAKSKKSTISYSDCYSQTLIELAEKDSDVVAITAAMPSGTGLSKFKEEFADRFFDVGIAEQHAVTLAAGLALNGAKPFVSLYSSFLQRAYDQVIHDACLQDAPLKFAIDRAGLVGRDGDTHQGVFDFAFLRTVPNMVVMAPANEAELQQMVITAANYYSPIAFRYPRGAVAGVEADFSPLGGIPELEIGKAEKIRSGNDGAVLAIGSMVHPTLKAAEKLAEAGIDLTVVNARFVKPLDEEMIKSLAEKHDCLITVEEHVLQGGFGSAVVEFLVSTRLKTDVRMIGLPDKFIEHGSQKELLQRYKLDEIGIREQIKSFFQE